MTRRRIATALVVSIGASIGLTITYLSGGNPQWEGALLGVAFGGIGWALVVAAHDFFAGVGTEERTPLHSSEQERRDVASHVTEPVTRRGLIVGLVATAIGALAVALGFPIRSLGSGPGRSLFTTSWQGGRRLVDEQGAPVREDTLETGTALTVFPEGDEDAGDSVVILVRVSPDRLQLPADRQGWAPLGYLAYSKICTHAGCPVGLFDTETGYLVCPCHQSSFDALHGAVPRFGPAARPLPQLPLAIDPSGYVVALGEMSDPVGPGFWDMPEGGART